MIKESLQFKKKKHNLIILTKGGINNNNKRKTNTKNSSTILTLKGEEFALKKNILNTLDINKEKIIKTVTSLKQELISEDDESEFNNDKKISIFDKNLKAEKSNILRENKDNEKKNNDLDFFLNLNGSINIKKTSTKFNKRISEKTFKGSNNAIICKTNSEIDKYTELENKKKCFKDVSKFALKSSLNEAELIEKNNISVYEFIKFNNENFKVKDSSINYNDSIYSKIKNKITKKSSLNTNIYEINNLEVNKSKINNNNNNDIVTNQAKFKNNFIKIKNPLNEKIKSNNSEISNSIKNHMNNIYNENQNDNISENKKLIIIKKTGKPKSSYFENNKNNEIKIKEEIKKIDTRESNSKNLLNSENNRIISRLIIENRRISCFLCEKFFKPNRIFVPYCKIHYMCRKCIKSYYEDIFENNNFSLKCPDLNCNKEIDFELLKKIISQTHCDMFQNKGKKEKNENKENNDSNIKKEIFLKDTKILFNSKVSEEKIKLYTQKHVLDINSNEKFYMYNKNKDIFCNKCLKPALFTKINGFFIKCLNCHNRICKYCLKEFEDFHMDIMHENHCKVYYRKDDDAYNFENSSKIIKFLTQLIFVLAMYYLLFAGIYYNVFKFLKYLFKFNDYKNCFLKFVMNYLSKFICFFCIIICSPFIILIYPFFPAIIAFTDY